MIRVVAILAVLWGGAAGAQGLPALHDVVGVSESDVLNLRAEPDANAPLVATLSHDARNIEVVMESDSGTWGRINVDETTGWASLRFLQRQADQDRREFPELLRCFGTEPFWSLDVTAGSVSFALMGMSEHRFRASDRRRATGRTDRWALNAEGPGALATAVIGTQTCSDGMSDRAYGLTGDVLVTDSDGIALYSGCCTLSPP